MHLTGGSPLEQVALKTWYQLSSCPLTLCDEFVSIQAISETDVSTAAIVANDLLLTVSKSTP